MKRLNIMVLILLALPLLFGMGSPRGESSPEKIPVPAKKIKGTFVDQTDIVTECRDVSIEGGTFIEGKRGDGTYTVSFEKISSVLFMVNDGKLNGIVTLNDGSTVELVLKKEQKAYGLTKYGTFQIKLLDIKKMIIGGSSQIRN
jgi:hypothetical protein